MRGIESVMPRNSFKFKKKEKTQFVYKTKRESLGAAECFGARIVTFAEKGTCSAKNL